jgi:hypothetical protein
MRLPQFDQWETVLLEWADSAAPVTGWHKPKPKEMEIDGCVTVGMVYAQSVDRITVVLSRDTVNEQIDGIITIPAAAVTGYARLKKVIPRSPARRAR